MSSDFLRTQNPISVIGGGFLPDPFLDLNGAITTPALSKASKISSICFSNGALAGAIIATLILSAFIAFLTWFTYLRPKFQGSIAFVFSSKGTFSLFDRLELHDQLLDAHRRLRILSQSPSHRQTSSRKAAIIDGLNIFVNNFFSFFLKLDSNPGQLPLDVIEYKVRTNTLLFFRFQSIEEEFSCSLEHFHFVNLNYRIVMDMRIVLIGSIVFLRHFDQ